VLGEQVAAIDAAGLPDPQAYQPYDAAFHDALVRRNNNSELAEAYRGISGRIRAIRQRLTRRAEQVTASHRVHHAILQAIREGRDDEAVALLVEHVYTNYRRLLVGTAVEAKDPNDDR
jgi:DNA-binding GntR family transcriptional regulator